MSHLNYRHPAKRANANKGNVAKAMQSSELARASSLGMSNEKIKAVTSKITEIAGKFLEAFWWSYKDTGKWQKYIYFVKYICCTCFCFHKLKCQEKVGLQQVIFS